MDQWINGETDGCWGLQGANGEGLIRNTTCLQFLRLPGALLCLRAAAGALFTKHLPVYRGEPEPPPVEGEP